MGIFSFFSRDEDEEEEEVEDGGSAAPTSRISFGELQFGRDYEIT